VTFPDGDGDAPTELILRPPADKVSAVVAPSQKNVQFLIWLCGFKIALLKSAA
jgi:hypothetical protein